MTKNWRKKYTWKFFKIFFLIKNCLHKRRPSYRSSLHPSKENIQHFKKWNVVTFFRVILALLDPYLDKNTYPGTQLNPDPIRIWIHKASNKGDEWKGHLITWRGLLFLFLSGKEKIWHTPSARHFFSASYFLKLHLHHFSKIKSQKESLNCKNQSFSYYFCMMIEGSGSRAGSGSIPLTSGSGSGRPKNTWIRWIRIRIRYSAFCWKIAEFRALLWNNASIEVKHYWN